MITFVSQSRRMTMEQAGVSETKTQNKKNPKQLFCQSQITAINLALEFYIFFFLPKFVLHSMILFNQKSLEVYWLRFLFFQNPVCDQNMVINIKTLIRYGTIFF